MIKWMKIAGYFVILAFIIILLTAVIILYNTNVLRIYKHLLDILVTFFIFLGFLTLGKFSKNKLLIYISYIILFVSTLKSIFSILFLLNPNILIFPVTNFNITLNLDTFLLILLPSGISSILEIILGISIINIKNVKFARETGILLIITGILYSIFYLIIAPISLSSSETSFIYQFFQKIPNYKIEFSIIVILIYAIITFFKSTMFLNASNNFEDN